MAADSRPLSVTVVPLVLALVSLVNLLIVVAMIATEGLPDPIVVFATTQFGWYLLPQAAFLILGVLGVAAAFTGWFVGRRRRMSNPRLLGVNRAVNIFVPAGIGFVMPSIWWQVDLPQTPTMIDQTDSTSHIMTAVLALVVPALIVGWRWLSARNTFGAAEATGVPAASYLSSVASSEIFRAVTVALIGVSARIADELAVGIVNALRFHSAYLPDDTVYQFRMPNGALLTITDNVLNTRRTLTVTTQTEHRTGYYQLRGYIIRPKKLRPEGGWFIEPDEKSEQRAINSLANNVQQAFAVQDDVVIDGAVVIDPSAPLVRIDAR